MEEKGLIHALLFDGKGGGQELELAGDCRLVAGTGCSLDAPFLYRTGVDPLA